MQNYHKYMAATPGDIQWGMCVVDAGMNRVPPNATFPLDNHPSPYLFTWEEGRILHEYQLVYLVEGEGFFESQHTSLQTLHAGHCFLLFPGVWHRYRPAEETGWTTYWIGFRGSYADYLVQQGFFTPSRPLMDIGFMDRLVSLFLDVLAVTKQEQPGYQQVAGSMITLLLGHIHARQKCAMLPGADIEQSMDRAKVLLLQSIGDQQTLRDVADRMHMSYSWFRKQFKQYTGYSPGQYLLRLRVQRARELLADPDRSLEQIADELGFCSQAHFTRVFKQRTGVPPGAFRTAHSS